MAKVDTILGEKVKARLESLGLETVTEIPRLGVAHETLEQGIRGFLMHMGLDISDPSIQATPERVADMFVNELCAGLSYSNFPKCTTTPNGVDVLDEVNWEKHVGARARSWNGKHTNESWAEENQDQKALFTSRKGAVDEMVLVDSIKTVSLCEHHFQTISGLTHIAYIPRESLLGLSKFARVTNFFARRPQVQERMTEQIYAALAFILGTKDIAVQQVATHNCMRARGAMDPQSKTTTSKMGGRFLTQPALRAEFLSSIPRGAL